MKAGTIMNSRHTASGKTTSKCGFRHTKVKIARKDRVCVVLFQVKSLIIRFWKTKTIPMRALKRRKLFVITGREKAGRVTETDELFSEPVDVPSSISSDGMTLSNNLVKSLSWTEVLEGLEASWAIAFSLRREPERLFLRRVLLPSASEDESGMSSAVTEMRGSGSSLLANASAVYSSMFKHHIDFASEALVPPLIMTMLWPSVRCFLIPFQVCPQVGMQRRFETETCGQHVFKYTKYA